MMKKNTWMPLLLLAAFIIFIYLLYNLVFSNKHLRDVRKEIDQVEQGMDLAIQRLENAGKTLDSAMFRIEDSREDIRIFREQTDTLRHDFDLRLDTAMVRLERILEQVHAERQSLQSLQDEMRKLE